MLNYLDAHAFTKTIWEIPLPIEPSADSLPVTAA